MTGDDEDLVDGPAVLERLRESRAVWNAGDQEAAQRIVDELCDEYGDVVVTAILGALRLGFAHLPGDEPEPGWWAE